MKDSIINDWRPETRALLNRLTAAGCVLIGCNNGEDVCYASEEVANPAKPKVKRCKDEADFVEELTATDEARLTVKTPDGRALQLFLVYGNDPGELVSDYHCHPVLDAVTEAHYDEWSAKPQPKTTNGERYPQIYAK